LQVVLVAAQGLIVAVVVVRRKQAKRIQVVQYRKAVQDHQAILAVQA
jgi:hypothetical protein